MELVAKSLPQFAEISSGLYKHKSKKKVAIMEYLNRVSNLIHYYSAKKTSTPYTTLSTRSNASTTSTLTSQASIQRRE